MKTRQLLVRDALARFARSRLASIAPVAFLGSCSVQAYERLQGLTELLFCNKEKAMNGYTLISAGVVGRLFEISPTGEMVWQYVNPMVRGGILAQGELPGKDMRGHLWNAVFKVHRYAPDHPGLAGRDLSPKGLIALPVSEKGKTGLHLMTEQRRPDRPGGSQQGGSGRGDGQRRGDGLRPGQGSGN